MARITWQKLQYTADGLARRLKRQPRTCPGCGSGEWQRRDRKLPHELLRCRECELVYRWPYETPEEMASFYQSNYRQRGLTTDLPDKEALARLIDCRFEGTEKDFSRVIALLRKLSVEQGAKILDFGANWGYGVWQLRQAGYNAVGYEVSVARAAYGENLGIRIASDWSEVEAQAPYDVVFSSHVLEHTPDPARAIAKKLSVLAKGGVFVAFFPNGSDHFQNANFSAFHRLWGLVHPVMLTEHFVQHALRDYDIVIGSHSSDDMKKLDPFGPGVQLGNLAGSELMVIARWRTQSPHDVT